MRGGSIGIGLVGYGYWGPNLARNFVNVEGATLVAVCDTDPGRLATAARIHPGATTTPHFRDLLRDGRVDAIVVATPVQAHFDLALAALEAGKHVLVEKPLTRTADQSRRLIDVAGRKGLVLMVDHTFLYTPSVRKIRELIADGIVGEVYYYDSTRASLGLFQSDVNVIWDLAVHDISILQYILNETPVAVSATGIRHVAERPESMAHVTLFFPSKTIAHISVNWLSPVKVRQTFIGGDRRMIVYDDVETNEKIKVYDKGITISNAEDSSYQLRVGYRAGDMWAPHLAATEALATEAQHFVDCIRDARTPVSDGESGLSVVEILEAASRSIAEQGNPVSLGGVQSRVRSVA